MTTITAVPPSHPKQGRFLTPEKNAQPDNGGTVSNSQMTIPKQNKLYFGTAQSTPDPIATMPIHELVDRKVAISLSKPVGVEKLLGKFSDTYEEKNRITFPYVMLAMAPFIAASFLPLPWLGFLGLPLSIYALYRLRKGHQRLDKAMRDQYRDLTTKLNIQPDFPLPYKGGPLPTKPAVTA